MDENKITYRFIYITKNGEDWNVHNRFTETMIGEIKWSPFAEEYCYYPTEAYWHKQVILSTTNMEDILRFIKSL